MPPPQTAFAIGLVLGFAVRPIIMGCIKSKEQEQFQSPAAASKAAQPAPVAAPVAVPVTDTPPEQEKVFQGVYGGLEVTDSTRAELKLKTMRDRLEAFLSESDKVLRRDLQLAQRARADGNKATCDLIMHRRMLLKRQISNRSTAAKQVLEMVDAVEDARDQKRLLASIQDGTKALNDVLKDLSHERVEKALQDKNEAIAYTEELKKMVGADVEMSKDELDAAYAELDALEAEQGLEEEVAAPAAPASEKVGEIAPPPQGEVSLHKALEIPEVPTVKPAAPVQPTADTAVAATEQRHAELV